MKVVIDTNVFISGIFFKGPPFEILDAWRCGIIEIVLSPEILEEYQKTSRELVSKFQPIDLDAWLELFTVNATISASSSLPKQVCTDPDDDKFLACAIASGSGLVVSGDKALLKVSGYQEVRVLTPRNFVDRYLKK